MSQVPVKWVDASSLKDNAGECDCNVGSIGPVPVIPLAALTEVVEGLNNIESHCDRIAVLSKCSGSIKEAQMAQVEAQRLLTQLEAYRKESA